MTNFILAASGGASSIVWLVILIVLVVVMLVLPSINQKKKLQAYQEMQNRLKAGDKVQTIGGIVGKINRIKEKDGIKTVLIETGDKNNKMVIEFDINAIAGVVEGLQTAPVTVSETQEESEEITTTEEEKNETKIEEKQAEEPKQSKKSSKKK